MISASAVKAAGVLYFTPSIYVRTSVWSKAHYAAAPVGEGGSND